MADDRSKTYHFVYLVSNQVNGKIYVGVRSTEDLEDGYLGSGTAIKAAVSKYGENNFTRVILSFHETRESALEHEASIVDEEFVRRLDTYNLVKGGTNQPNSDKRLSEEHKAKISAANKGRLLGFKQSEEAKKKIAERSRLPRPNMKGRPTWNAGMKGQYTMPKRGPMSEETKAKISATKRKRQHG